MHIVVREGAFCRWYTPPRQTKQGMVSLDGKMLPLLFPPKEETNGWEEAENAFGGITQIVFCCHILYWKLCCEI
jgi:hypothetical protein